MVTICSQRRAFNRRARGGGWGCADEEHSAMCTAALFNGIATIVLQMRTMKPRETHKGTTQAVCDSVVSKRKRSCKGQMLQGNNRDCFRRDVDCVCACVERRT